MVRCEKIKNFHLKVNKVKVTILQYFVVRGLRTSGKQRKKERTNLPLLDLSASPQVKSLLMPNHMNKKFPDVKMF